MSPRLQDLSHPCLLTEVEQRFRKLLFFFLKMAITASSVRPVEDIGSPLIQNTCAHTHTFAHNHGEPVGPIRERAQGGEGAGWQRLVCSGLRCPAFLFLPRCPHHHSQSLWHSLWFSEAP